jgi:hypothetical protein
MKGFGNIFETFLEDIRGKLAFASFVRNRGNSDPRLWLMLVVSPYCKLGGYIMFNVQRCMHEACKIIGSCSTDKSRRIGASRSPIRMLFTN